MFEDLGKIKNRAVKISDKDIIRSLYNYIETQGKKLISQERDLVNKNDIIYERDQMLLKAKREIEDLHEKLNDSHIISGIASGILSYYKDFEKGFCDINFENRTIEWSGEATLNTLGRFNYELVKIFGKDKVKEITNDFKVINNNWKIIQ